MSTASTHVLDAARGLPAAGLAVTLGDRQSVTDDDGRVSWGEVEAGRHVLTFAAGDWFGAQGRETFFRQVVLDVVLGPGHTHVALLLSPFAYTTYRGS
ncbi:hydroxyisourate hydrolase [Promicromonospora thailandica]|uniref:5-hydroxyisourate hydrolase n=1 Tax=Promicromonospora thailandica TaxID=765201 RepID=A0A9X2G7T4_9MICO|nr:hydroxyisourate hydrolase [Promicromonospora thailandica]MCP2264161.1 5-hydroxyisourate hydrolase [Promicromonospora thailandica]BFF21171.1 hydroxyisourate hydrolase [Promicromonospora thailandica]